MTNPIEPPSDGNNKPLAYAISALARETSLSRATLYMHVKSGLLKTTKVGRRTIVLAADVERWLATLA